MRLIIGVCGILLASTACAQRTDTKPLETTAIHPVKVERRDDGVFFLDFGRDAFAQFKLHTPVDQKVTVRLGEKLSESDHLDSKPAGSIRFLQTTLRDGVAVLPKNDSRWIPAPLGSVMPFRYVELKGIGNEISTQAITAAATQVAVNYPFDDRASDFACSDEKLNAVWNLCKYSIKATSYAGIFVDGDRERKPYEADAFINGLGWYCCTNDLTLPAITDRYLIDHPTWPTEWSMFSVLCAWNDYLYTGDLQALRLLYPDLKAKSLRALERNDGLISTQNVQPGVYESIHLGKEKLKDIVDWPIGERDGFQMMPVNTVVNAFHCQSMTLLAKMASALGDNADVENFHTAAAKCKTSLNEKLTDPLTGLYLDGQGSSHSSLNANMFPLAFGLVPVDRREKVLAFCRSKGMACSVYGAQFLLDGLFDNNAGNDAIALMIAPGDRSWRHMVEDTGTTLTLEAWDQKYKPNQDWNHAWGAAPANLLIRKVLGVEPGEPGFSRAIIRPCCAGKSSSITWAYGKVPTAKGEIQVDWKTSGNTLSLSVTLPKEVRGQIYIPPDWEETTLKLDGRLITPTYSANQKVIEIEPGSHQLTAGS